MNLDLLPMVQFARANRKTGFTHWDFNEAHNSVSSTARLSELNKECFGFVFDWVHYQGAKRKRFFLVYEPPAYRSRLNKNDKRVAA